MKCGVILFHKEIYDIYKERWIKKCLDSIYNQTFQDFTIYELCYSDPNSNNFVKLCDDSVFFTEKMENHIFAMNFILDKAFEHCDVVFNVNLDDLYDHNRFALQIEEVKKGFDLVSSDFQLIQEKIDDNGKEEDILGIRMTMHNLDIKTEQDKEHNTLAHPVICMTKGFWERNKYYKTDELGYEDFSLWKKAVANNEKISIIDQVLLYYRLSAKQTGRVHSPEKKADESNSDNIPQ